MRSNAGCVLGDEGAVQPPPEQLWHNVARLLRYCNLRLFTVKVKVKLLSLHLIKYYAMRQ
jgi:hypothetical protein